MSDGISQMHRDMREEKERGELREKYLAAALSQLTSPSDVSMTEVVKTYDAVCLRRRNDYDADGNWRPYRYDNQKVAHEAHVRLASLARGNRAEWMFFLLKDVGIDDAEMRAKFMALSPFRGCLVILSKEVRHGASCELSGDAAQLIESISPDKGWAKVESVFDTAVQSYDRALRGSRFRVYRVTPRK